MSQSTLNLRFTVKLLSMCLLSSAASSGIQSQAIHLRSFIISHYPSYGIHEVLILNELFDILSSRVVKSRCY